MVIRCACAFLELATIEVVVMMKVAEDTCVTVRQVLHATLVLATAGMAVAAPSVPPALQQPGTQPTEVNSFASNCDTCHANTGNPDLEPSHGWKGSMMSHAVRDGLYWATLAVAEQDFLPDADPQLRGGAGDLCLRCHGPGGWLGGLSEPTDGSLYTDNEARGVECEFCHLLVNPDQALSIAGTTEVQSAPFTAFDDATGEGYVGSGQYVINGGGTRLGPFLDADANHPFYQSTFHRSGELCGTCHDVSNPVTGDVAHNNGAQTTLPPGAFSGDLASPIEQKAQFLNPPAAYGIVERTYSEWRASLLDTWAVNDFSDLPEALKASGGALDLAYHRSWDARADADYVDGAIRAFTCQTCHMAAATGLGCNKNGVLTRKDLPRHDLTGGGYWMPDVVAYQNAAGTLRLGGDMTADLLAGLSDGRLRAQEQLASAASLAASQEGEAVTVRVTNLTGHKLISGYPEGRRMWLNLRWKDSLGAVIQEVGAYGAIGRTVTDADGDPHDVASLLDPDATVMFEVVAGLDQQWAQQLLGLGYDADLILEYDRLTSSSTHTLGELAGESPGTTFHSFHFVLNNTIIADNRIPPFGFDRDLAELRNCLPVPAAQYGDPPSGGAYDYFWQGSFTVPDGAVEVEVRLLYQQTSWEYVHFLWQANDGASPTLGQEGDTLLDAWLNTEMSPPFEMGSVSISITPTGDLVFADGFETGTTERWSQP